MPERTSSYSAIPSSIEQFGSDRFQRGMPMDGVNLWWCGGDGTGKGVNWIEDGSYRLLRELPNLVFVFLLIQSFLRSIAVTLLGRKTHDRWHSQLWWRDTRRDLQTSGVGWG